MVKHGRRPDHSCLLARFQDPLLLLKNPFSCALHTIILVNFLSCHLLSTAKSRHERA